MGTQFHEFPSYLRAKEIIEAAWLGDIKEVHVITDRPRGWWAQGVPAPTEAMAVPRDLWWDLWLGPAQKRAYHSSYAHFLWRGWWDFGCGAIGDMAIHLMDCAVWSLGLTDQRVRVETVGTPLMESSGPTQMKATFHFPATQKRKGVVLHWYEGKETPPKAIADKLPMNGALFVGTEGEMAVKHASREAPVLFPEKTFADRPRPMETHAPTPGHHQQWITAIKTGSETSSPFSYAGPFTELVLLGNVSFRSGQSFTWDPKGMKTEGAPKAEPYLTKSYRRGFELAPLRNKAAQR